MAAETPDTEAAVPSPNLPTLKELSNALDTVVDWHTLGIKLGVKGYQLRQIEKNYRDSSRCKIEMLDCCVQSGNPPTWKKVADALCQMGEHQSAFKIRRKHLKGLNVVRSHKNRAIQMRKHISAYKIRRKRLECLKGLRVFRTRQDQAIWMRKHKSAYKMCRKRLKSLKGLPVAHMCENWVFDLAFENLQAIKGKFASLLALADSRLQQKSISMGNLRVFLAALYSPDDDSNDARAVDASDFLNEVLDTAQDVGEILMEMSKRGLVNYKNYRTLRSIVVHYAEDDQELMEKVNQYGEDLAGFALVTRMQDYLDVELQDYDLSGPDKLLDELKIKVRENITERTLQYVSDLWDSLSFQLKLPHCSMLFNKVAKGCIEISWLLPCHLTTFAIRRAEESIEYFIDQRFLQVAIAGRCIFESGVSIHENINGEEKSPGRKGDPDEGNLQTSDKEHPVHESIKKEIDPERKSDPHVGNLEGLQAAECIREEEPVLVENVSKVKEPSGGRPGDLAVGNFPTPEFSEGSSEDEHKDEEEAFPEHELRLRSAMIISTNFSHLWQYLDPSRLLPTLLEKFLITEKDEKEANSYSGYAQTCIILRGLFSDYCPANRLFKLCDTLATIPGQEHLGEKLLQDFRHPKAMSAHSPSSSIAATPSVFSELSQKFKQLEDEAVELLDQFPGALLQLKQVLATLVFPLGEGKVVPLIDPHCYENALTVRELFRILAPHWNPLSPELLGFLLEASGCSMAVTKFAEFIDTRNSKGHLVLCVRQMPSLVDFRSVHSGPLSKLQSFHHSFFAQLPEDTSSRNTIRISVEVDKSSLHLSDYERITTALSGLFWMPKLSLVFIGCTQSIISWQTFPEFSKCSPDHVTDFSGYTLLSQCGVTRTAIGEVFYKFPTIEEVELWEASCYGQLDKVISLINAGANVNVTTRNGSTPLIVASQQGHLSVVRTLLQAGATVNTTNQYGHTALLLAADQEHEDVVQLLIEVDADPDLRDQDEETALMVAARWGSVGIVTKLIQHGANVNLTNKNGETALYMACSKGHAEIVNHLLTAKAHVNLQRKDGSTALMVASFQGHPSVVRTLLQAGATVNTINQQGYTALMAAAESQHEDIVQLLIEVRADPDLQDENQGTALMVAARKGNVGIVRKLIQHGANVNITNKDGLTALDLASLEGHPEVYQELVTHVSDQEENEDEPEPPQPFEWTED